MPINMKTLGLLGADKISIELIPYNLDEYPGIGNKISEADLQLTIESLSRIFNEASVPRREGNKTYIPVFNPENFTVSGLDVVKKYDEPQEFVYLSANKGLKARSNMIAKAHGEYVRRKDIVFTGKKARSV